MKIIYRYQTIAVLLLAFTLLTACKRTELCYDHYPKASLSLTWEQEWERDYGMAHQSTWDAAFHGFDYEYLKPGIPEWVNLVKYRNDNREGEHYLRPEGGEIVFQEQADRSFLLYNGDTEYIIFSDIASLPEARATATPRSRSSITYVMERHPGAKSANPPDLLYSAYIDNLPAIAIHESRHIPVKMQPLVYTYVVHYEFEHGLEYVHLARGALGGMAESVYMRDGRTSEDATIVLYDCDIVSYGCEAKVRSFGIPGFPDEYYGRTEGDTPDRPYTLNLEVQLFNNKVLEFNFDVTDQLKKQPRGGVITVKGIRVEDEDSKTPIDSNFDIDLSGWGEEEVDLPI